MSTNNHKEYLYPLIIRVWHIINALGFLVLIYTGLNLQYSGPGAWMDFGRAIEWHNIAGMTVSINYALFLIGNMFTWNGKYYIIRWKGYFKRFGQQLNYYLFGIFKGKKYPFPPNKDSKFNPLQQIAYIFTMFVMVPLIIFTGLSLYFPEVIPMQIMGMNGVFITALLHMATGFALTLFLIIHVYFSTMGKKPSSNFRSIMTGWHEHHD